MREAFAASEATRAAALAGAGKAEEQGTDAANASRIAFRSFRMTSRAVFTTGRCPCTMLYP